MKSFAFLAPILFMLAKSQSGCSEASSEATNTEASGGSANTTVSGGTTSVGSAQAGGIVNRATGGTTVGASTGGQPTGQGGASTGGMTTSNGATQSTGGTGRSVGGNSTGGVGPSAGGNSTGGRATGGDTSSGGMSAGGATGGNISTGGQRTVGGSATGGRSAGGASAGGMNAGGASTGGIGNGGANTGGAVVATGGSGASDGTTPYNPCPTNGDPCKILPLGDSITWGIQYDGAYRVELFSKAIAAQQKITFTGSLSNGPATVSNVTFPKSNEGHSGWTIDQIAGQVPSPALTTIPNIVLLMIGTNDVYASSGQATMPNRLGTLMDKIIAAAPNALLVVAKITPLNNASWNATIKTYNDAIPGLVQTRAAAGKHVMLGDMNTGFTSAMLSTDNIHPNKLGYDFMGDKWYALIGSLLPK